MNRFWTIVLYLVIKRGERITDLCSAELACIPNSCIQGPIIIGTLQCLEGLRIKADAPKIGICRLHIFGSQLLLGRQGSLEHPTLVLDVLQAAVIPPSFPEELLLLRSLCC